MTQCKERGRAKCWRGYRATSLMFSTLENSLAVSQKTIPLQRPTHSMIRYFARRNENICPDRLNTNVYSCNLEKIQMSIGGKTCKQIAVYLSMKYYLAIKKEWPFDTCSNMMNLIFITLNKRGLTKWYILYYTIDIKF